MPADEFGLPKDLGNGLTLRWAIPADIEAIAAFNLEQHSDPRGDQPELWIKDWTRELLNGGHPTTNISDCTVVIDKKGGGKVVSSSILVSQTWRCEGITFGLGRPEIIATDLSYRRRGLVRLQMDLLHEKSRTKGELVQAITGIPWFYRQFGYEMALKSGGDRRMAFDKVPKVDIEEEEKYRLRKATAEDLNLLRDLYEELCKMSMISCARDQAIWDYELSPAKKKIVTSRNLFVIEGAQGHPVGYAEIPDLTHAIMIRELAVDRSQPLREVALFLARKLKETAEENKTKKTKPISEIVFSLGEDHPAYAALASELVDLKKGYAWYMRVADLTAFFHHLAPVLESRLATSSMSAFSGSLKLNFYTNQTNMTFDNGKLISVEPYSPEHYFDGDAYFPGLTFLQLLFGYRSLDQLKASFADCFTSKPETPILVNILFPKRVSMVVPVA